MRQEDLPPTAYGTYPLTKGGGKEGGDLRFAQICLLKFRDAKLIAKEHF